MAGQTTNTTPTESADTPEENSETEKPYPWTTGQEQAWRAFIIDAMANADIDGQVLVENMQKVYEWGMTGKVNQPKSKGKINAL